MPLRAIVLHPERYNVVHGSQHGAEIEDAAVVQIFPMQAFFGALARHETW